MSQSIRINNALILELLGRGVQSNLANKIAEHFPDLQTLVATKNVVLSQDFNVSAR